MNHDKRVENIVRAAERCRDPERLREMADALERYSAYAEARHVRNKALEIERHFAELAANK